jgi:hypothetical protein
LVLKVQKVKLAMLVTLDPKVLKGQ